jgi:hypothetical protein
MSKKYIKIKNSFDDIVKVLKNNGVDYRQAVVLKNDVFVMFDHLKKEIERSQHHHKKSTKKEDRFVKIETTNSANSKITYRPDNGECLIKLSKTTPEWKMEIAQKFGEQVIANFPDDVKLTLRGTLKWSDTNRYFRTTLSDNNKSQFKIIFQ